MMIKALRTTVVLTMWLLMATPLWADYKDSAPMLLAHARSGNVAEIRGMLDRGVDPNARIKDGYVTALHGAAEQNKLDVINLLIDRGANIEAETGYGQTPLVSAATNGREDAIRLLHARGASLDHRTLGGSTALNLVAHSDPIRPDIVRLLLEMGANPNIPDDYGRTPLHWAAQNANVQVIKLILAYPKAELSGLDKYGYTPLYYAREGSRPFAKTPEDTKLSVAMLEHAGAKERAFNIVRIRHELGETIIGMFVGH